jgi:cytochrome c oxidase subunit 2
MPALRRATPRRWLGAAGVVENRAVTRTPRRRRVLRTALFVAALGLLLAACAQDAPYDSLAPAGPVADKQAELYWLVFWIATGVFVLVEGALVFALIRFRSRSAEGTPRQIHGNTRLEIMWTILPALLLAGVAVPTVGTIFDLASRPQGDVLEVNVTGHQWWWEVEYPDLGVVTANEIHVPTDRPVAFNLTSEDVIHSFSVPRLAGKQDLIPGRTSTLYIEAPNAGTYLGLCQEFCGLSHANMRFRVIAEEAADFDAWVQGELSEAASPPKGSLEAEGMGYFAGGQCIGCHTIGGVEGAVGTLGPNLTHVGSRDTFAGGIFELNEGNLRRWLEDAPRLKPGSKMPSGIRDMGLTDEQIEALVAYLMSLT